MQFVTKEHSRLFEQRLQNPGVRMCLFSYRSTQTGLVCPEQSKQESDRKEAKSVSM